MKCRFQLVEDDGRGQYTHACVVCGHKATAPSADASRLHRRCSGGTMPGIARRVKNFAAAVVGHHVAGCPTSSPEVIRARLDQCEACDLYDGSHCLHPSCGCPVRRKTHWADQSCPVGRWTAVKPFIRYVRTSELVAAAHAAQAMVPESIDAVVAIPRSGLLPASVLAMALHLPLYAVRRDGSLADLNNGRRSEFRGRGSLGDHEPVHALLVDDSVHSGATIVRVRQSLAIERVTTLAVFARPEVVHHVDLFCEYVRTPHVFEWNIFNCPFAQYFAFDMDGVICEDCYPEVDDDGPRYRGWLRTVRPLHLPRYTEVAAIITARLSKYRAETEAWLAAHRVRYRKLIMGPWPSIGERARADVAAWKAHHVNQLRSVQVFVESCPNLSRAIAPHLKRASVVCPELGGSVT